VLLIPAARYGHQSSGGKPGQYAMRGSGPAPRQADEFRALEAAIGLTEEEPQHAPEDRREERTSEA